MKQTYVIEGMHCNHCIQSVTEALATVEGVLSVNVSLDPPVAEVEMKGHIPTEALKMAVMSKGNYTILEPGSENPETVSYSQPEWLKEVDGKFYCPMLCEGEKLYDEMGPCPICGMDLVATKASHNDNDNTYRLLLRKFKVALLFTLPVFIIAMMDMLSPNPLHRIAPPKTWNWIQFALAVPVVFYSCRMFFQRAYRSVVTRNLNMFTLIGMGAGTAFVYSCFALVFPGIFPEQFRTDDGAVFIYFEAVTVILTLVLMGQLLEARAHRRTSGAINALLHLVPPEATLIDNGVDKVIPASEIVQGHMIRIKPGDRIPVDGVIIKGSSSVDESMITGESVPVEKSEGDALIAGTINGHRSVVMKAEKVGSETLLSQIVQMVREASRSRAPIQQLADRISGYFVPAVLFVAVITFIIWAIIGPQPIFIYAMVNSIAVMIIACPCALGLATPMSVMVGVGKGAQSGVLIKNAESLERLNDIDTLVIDKTGTITEGSPSVEGIYSAGQYGEKELMAMVLSLNKLSGHPIADATVEFANVAGTTALPVLNFENIAGKGVKGTVNGREVAVGNRQLMVATGTEMPVQLEREIYAAQEKGKTVSYISLDKRAVGYLVISDAIKDGSIEAIQWLLDQRIDVLMLTGDNAPTAKSVAEKAGLSRFRAECLPQDKLKEIERLKAEGRVVAMAGDGINDAPALAVADVGIAMGTGTDVAIESAGITLVKGDLNGIVRGIKLSRAVMKNIRQNLFFAFVYNTIGIPIAAGVLYPVFGLLLSPMIAAAAMSFSSVSVIANSLRLRNVKV